IEMLIECYPHYTVNTSRLKVAKNNLITSSQLRGLTLLPILHYLLNYVNHIYQSIKKEKQPIKDCFYPSMGGSDNAHLYSVLLILTNSLNPSIPVKFLIISST